MTKTPMTRIECAMTDEGLKSFKPALGRCSETCVVGRGRRLDAPPPLPNSAPKRGSEKREKSVRKLVNHFKTISVNFSLRPILRSPEVIINCQWTKMVFR